MFWQPPMTCFARSIKKQIAILDTRSEGEYLGTHVRAARGGAIPGAIHIEWTDNLAADGKFKSNAELKAMYDKAGITPDKEVDLLLPGRLSRGA